MRTSTALFALSELSFVISQVVTGRLGDATTVLDNPMGAVYQATIPKGKYMDISGSVVAVSAGDKGTEFAVNFSGLPKEGGPFLYHIHVDPVPADGNCNGTLAHLDPYERGELDPCSPDRPETCQVGDLAGKYGRVNGTKFQRTFSDPFVSLHENQGAFLGNRSFAIHFANKTRIACANFTSISNAQGPGMIGFNSSGNPMTTLVPFQNGTNAAATFTSSAPGATTAPEQRTTSAGSQIQALNSILFFSSILAGVWSCL